MSQTDGDSMLTLGDVDRIVAKVAAGVLGDRRPARIISRRYADHYGQDALNVTLVVSRQTEDELTGDMASRILVEVQRDLQAEGEDRFAFVNYTTEDDLIADADPEQ